MNFTEIVAEVLRITKRPDKILDIRREVNAAVNQFSMDADFARDLEELLLPISVTEYTQAISWADLPRWRKFQYIRRGGTRNYLCILDSSQLLKNDCDMRDRYYIVGQGVRISMTALAPTLDVAYWAFPPILTDSSPNFWQLEGNWPAVLDRATSKVFANIGDDASANKHEASARIAFAGWRATQIRL